MTSPTCTGMRMAREWSATARLTAWRIHQVAYVRVVCPNCGSDRLIPLSFPPPWRRVRHLGQAELGPRPVIKCVQCGQRNYISIKVHRRCPPIDPMLGVGPGASL
jgi:DNA-directed RNA polymerase subunit RPC12/RpoP